MPKKTTNRSATPPPPAPSRPGLAVVAVHELARLAAEIEAHGLTEIAKLLTLPGVRQSTRELPCPLTLEEMGYRSQQADGLFREAEILLEERRSTSASLKRQADNLAAQAREFVREAASGSEDREVPVAIVPRAGQVTVIRLDTGEVVEERAMTEAERQTEIPHDSDQGAFSLEGPGA